MNLPAHIGTGLIIGKLTGNYLLATIAATAVDLDHLLPYARDRILLKPKKLIKALFDENYPCHGQRNYLHNVLVWLIISLVIMISNFQLGFIVSISYLSHLILDSLDSADYHPFYPYKKINLKGPVQFFSMQEGAFSILLFLVYFLL